MKSRKGFVSNSSSSSFILIKEGGEFTKNNLSEKRKELCEALGYSGLKYEEDINNVSSSLIKQIEPELEEEKTYSVGSASIEDVYDISEIKDIVKFFNGKIIWDEY